MSSNKELFRIEPSDQEPEVISVEEALDNADLYHTAGAQDPKGDTAGKHRGRGSDVERSTFIQLTRPVD